MTKRLLLFIPILSLLLLSGSILYTKEQTPDVEHYLVEVTPDLKNKTIEGYVSITFSASSEQVVFNCGNLQVTKVEGETFSKYQQNGNQLIISLKSSRSSHKISITYKGQPTKGLLFSAGEAYTVYHTEEWMVCNTAPQDKATIEMFIMLPDSLDCIASGTFIRKKAYDDVRSIHVWSQSTPTPAYTYGFAAGSFKKYSEKHKELSLTYYSSSHNPEELKNIFGNTEDMIRFFEEKSGMPYFQNSYRQVLIGNHYQEMSGFAVLKQGYGAMVLKDSTETNLISHELAHQWWGNLITCKTWNHMWLNEAFATYMSAAYNEYRFGLEKYNADIESYRKVYEKIKGSGNDKSLVYQDWNNPTPQDRNIVYFKGAYVLHLLRQELGDDLFWKAIKAYSIKYYGKSVTTQEFQKSIETTTGKDLNLFFKEWVY